MLHPPYLILMTRFTRTGWRSPTKFADPLREAWLGVCAAATSNQLKLFQHPRPSRPRPPGRWLEVPAGLSWPHVRCRHGARTPLSSRSEMWRGQKWDVCGEAYQAAAVRLFSTAGVENPVSRHDQRQRAVVLDGGCRKGELTLLGQSQALDLGRWLRRSYVTSEGFLPHTYQDGVVEAHTTNFSRTIATLRGVLTGLYPDLPKQHREEHHQQQPQQQEGQTPQPTSKLPPQQQLHLQSQPQPQKQLPHLQPPRVPHVTTSADLDEILYADTRTCPHLGSFQAVSRELGRAAVRADPEYEWARGELLRLLGIDAVSFDSDWCIFTHLHDVLTSLEAHGKALPPGFEGHPRLLAAINRLVRAGTGLVRGKTRLYGWGMSGRNCNGLSRSQSQVTESLLDATQCTVDGTTSKMYVLTFWGQGTERSRQVCA
ncbi:hypothetical protein Vretifemale_9781 [Volvox reticuliferus]|uniref:Uncharacterized protein n=1 Tax=Volvox reticuliferus TaxID=1737510 RepID=A0A8J4CGK4_9CHLO|nr:hypothetical protein Vretifemale_9781 [Volvox reticuliferus]